MQKNNISIRIIGNITNKKIVNPFKVGSYTFLNPFSYLKLRRYSLLDKFDYIGIDGVLLVLIFKVFLKEKIIRTSFDMTSLAKVIFDKCSDSGQRFIFIGSTIDNITGAIANIKKNYNINIVSFCDGFFRIKSKQDILYEIKTYNPDYIIIGMGTLRQEALAIEIINNGYNKTIFTCGGFFHQTAERLNYYPAWIDSLNLRWLFRIVSEPHLIKRYFFVYPISVLFIIYDIIIYTVFKNRNQMKL